MHNFFSNKIYNTDLQICKALLYPQSLESELIGYRDAPRHPGFVSRPERHMVEAVIQKFLSIRRDDLNLRDFRFLVGVDHRPELLEMYLRYFLRHSIEDPVKLVAIAWNNNVCSYICACVQDLPTSRFWSLSTGASLFRFLIENGADVHRGDVHRGKVHRGKRTRRTAYYRLLDCQYSQFDIDGDIQTWLEILRRAGVCLSNYLEQEHQLLLREWDGFHVDSYDNTPDTAVTTRRITMVKIGGFMAPTWRHCTDPDSHAYEVLEEFKNLGPGRSDWLPPLPPYPTHEKDYKIWTTCKSPSDYFPFYPTPLRDEEHDMKRYPYLYKTYDLAVKITTARFQQRQAKKMGKSRPKRKAPASKMPGSWVDG